MDWTFFLIQHVSHYHLLAEVAREKRNPPPRPPPPPPGKVPIALFIVLPVKNNIQLIISD